MTNAIRIVRFSAKNEFKVPVCKSEEDAFSGVDRDRFHISGFFRPAVRIVDGKSGSCHISESQIRLRYRFRTLNSSIVFALRIILSSRSRRDIGFPINCLSSLSFSNRAFECWFDVLIGVCIVVASVIFLFYQSYKNNCLYRINW